MRARIDISEVEARTKIRAKYLRAIENEDWDLLPGTVYARSFLRTYGDFLGLDSRMLVDEFNRRYEHPLEHDQQPVAPLHAERERRERTSAVSRMPSWTPIAGVVVVILVLLFAVGLATQPGSSTNPIRHATRARSHRGVAKTTTSTTAPAAPAASTVTLQLTPTGTVYVCLVNGRGTKLIDEQTFSSGQTIPTETAHKLLLTLGRAAVAMKVNGSPYTVAPSAEAIRLLITPAGVQHVPLSQAPTCP